MNEVINIQQRKKEDLTKFSERLKDQMTKLNMEDSLSQEM